MKVAEACRHWADEMHRAASAVEEQSDGSVECMRVIDVNRAVADTLADASNALDAAIAVVKSGAGENRIPAEFDGGLFYEVDGFALERLRAALTGGAA